MKMYFNFFLLILLVGDGTVQRTESSKLVGGNYAKRGEFPQICHMQVDGSICGCTVVSVQRIVTAALCFVSIEGGTKIAKKLDDAKAYFGTLTYLGTGGQVSKIVSYRTHKKFQIGVIRGYMHNYATAQLETSLKFNDQVAAMNLYSSNPVEFKDAWDEMMTSRGAHCRIVGWAATNENVTKPTKTSTDKKFMKKVEVNVLPEDECLNKKVNTKVTMIPYGEICIKGKNGFEVLCKEDSGTPLVCGDYVWGIATGIINSPDFAVPYFYLLHWYYLKDLLFDESGCSSLASCDLLIFFATGYTFVMAITQIFITENKPIVSTN